MTGLLVTMSNLTAGGWVLVLLGLGATLASQGPTALAWWDQRHRPGVMVVCTLCPARKTMRDSDEAWRWADAHVAREHGRDNTTGDVL